MTVLWFLDTLVRIRVAADQSADGISVLESTARHGDSPPLHVHHSEDEVFHVLDGDIRLHLDGRELALGAGESALAPKGIPHTYRVESDRARWLVVTTGSRFEQFVRAFGRPAERDELPEPAGPPTEAQQQALAAAAAAHEIELVGPPL